MYRETHVRSVSKAASWRALGTLDTFLLTLLVSGSVKLAGSVASLETITKIALYYFHERAWSFVPWGRYRIEEPPRGEAPAPQPGASQEGLARSSA